MYNSALRCFPFGTWPHEGTVWSNGVVCESLPESEEDAQWTARYYIQFSSTLLAKTTSSIQKYKMLQAIAFCETIVISFLTFKKNVKRDGWILSYKV